MKIATRKEDTVYAYEIRFGRERTRVRSTAERTNERPRVRARVSKAPDDADGRVKAADDDVGAWTSFSVWLWGC